jgi:hypothetical protein
LTRKRKRPTHSGTKYIEAVAVVLREPAERPDLQRTTTSGFLPQLPLMYILKKSVIPLVPVIGWLE